MSFFHSPKLSVIMASLLLSACSSTMTKPDSKPLEEAASLPSHVSILAPINSQLAAVETNSLSQLISSTELDKLIEEAFHANPNLQKSWLTLQVRQAERKRVDGNQLPSVTAGLDTSKVKSTDLSFTGSINVNWQADLWGKLGDQSNAAVKNIEQQQFLYQSTRDTLASEIMKAWLGLIAQQKAIEIQQSRISILEKNEIFITQRYRSGLGDSEDLSSARSAKSSALASLAEQQEVLLQQQRSLQNLLGRTERESISVNENYPEVVLPLADLPEQSLRRRPDLKAAYLAIAAADINSVVAYKELLPSINIKAALQEVADSPSAALLLNPIWSLLAQLTAPLYQGGQLRADIEIAQLQTASAYQDYRETLLLAVTEVENTLSLETSLQKRQLHIEDSLSNARDSLDKYQSRYRSGLATILDLLNVEKNTYDLESELNNLIYQRLSNRIDLGLALGLPTNTGAVQ